MKRKAPVVRRMAADEAKRIRSLELMVDFAAVVKELVENALDADSSNIRVCVDMAKFSVTVADDGTGMSLEELQAVAEDRYMSSKHVPRLSPRSGVADSRITFGYRGEALHSLAQLALLEIRSRPRLRRRRRPGLSGLSSHIDATHSKVMAHGQAPRTRSYGDHSSLWLHEPGTVVMARHLFHAWPVRRESTKPRSQLARIRQTLQLLALQHPAVRITVVDGDKQRTVFDDAPRASFLERVDALYGDNARHMRQVSISRDGFLVHGLVAEHAPLQRQGFRILFVNNRCVNATSDLYQEFVRLLRGAFGQRVDRSSALETGTRSDTMCFLLHVTCPEQSFDQHMEPDKSCLYIPCMGTVHDLLRGIVSVVMDPAHASFRILNIHESELALGSSEPEAAAESMDENSNDLALWNEDEDCLAEQGGPSAVPLELMQWHFDPVVDLRGGEGPLGDGNVLVPATHEHAPFEPMPPAPPPPPEAQHMRTFNELFFDAKTVLSPAPEDARRRDEHAEPLPPPAHTEARQAAPAAPTRLDFGELFFGDIEEAGSQAPVQEGNNPPATTMAQGKPEARYTKRLREPEILRLAPASAAARSAAPTPTNVTRDMLRKVTGVMQADKKFLIARAGDVLLCIDQHAADERVRLEQLEVALSRDMADGHGSVVKSTTVKNPLRKAISVDEAHLLDTYQDSLARLGFQFLLETPSGLGSGTILVVQGVPEAFGNTVPPAEILDVASELRKYDPSVARLPIRPRVFRRILSYKACRSAIKFGDALTESECRTLISKLSETQLPFQCAHGRPSSVMLLDGVASFIERTTVATENAHPERRGVARARAKPKLGRLLGKGEGENGIGIGTDEGGGGGGGGPRLGQ